MKKHSKGHTGSLYYNCKAKSGNDWKTMQLLGHTCLKELTPIIRFTKILLIPCRIKANKLVFNQLFPQ
jgi:hypothetical protein